MNKVQIYTDSSTAADKRAGIAMVIVAASYLTEYSEVLTDVYNTAAEMWAVLWAVQHLAQNGLDGMVLTDCAHTAHVWQRHAPTFAADPERQLAAYSISHAHLQVRYCARGTSIFNRRADALARAALRGSDNCEGLGRFLSQHDIHAACLASRAKQSKAAHERASIQI
jgi:ribonuclease HI